MVAVRRAATYADLEALPPHMVGEIIDGVLYASPRPRARHAQAAAAALVNLGNPFWLGQGGPGGWHLLMEPELRLGGATIVPDLAGWRVERMATLPDVKFFELAPDWVCEVVSPSTARIDRGPKMATYAHHRVGHLWMLDPEARTLETYRVQDERWLLLRTFVDDEPVRAEPFDAVELSMKRWWLPGEPPPDQPR